MPELQPHIQLSSDLGIRYAILPGDPARIDRVKAHLDEARELAFNREFRSAAGTYKGVPVLVLSTGIGGASAAIAAEELHNIGVTHAIRIGSAGAYQSDIPIGQLLIACGAVKDDGASNTYAPTAFPAVPSTELMNGCIRAARTQGFSCRVGVVRSHDSFYTDDEMEICRKWSRYGVIGADLETAALFTVGAVRGMKTASILNNVVLYEADAADAIGDYVDGAELAAAGERAEIITALEALAAAAAEAE